MYGSGEFKRPSSDDQFELMCHQLFRAIWNDDGCTLHGSSGQRQDGIDILGIGPSGRTAVQCKFFDKTQFTLKTVRDDVVRVDGSNLELRHLIFATTAPSDPKVSA